MRCKPQAVKPLGGFGQTQSTDEEYSIALFAEDLYELLQALKIDGAFPPRLLNGG